MIIKLKREKTHQKFRIKHEINAFGEETKPILKATKEQNFRLRIAAVQILTLDFVVVQTCMIWQAILLFIMECRYLLYHIRYLIFYMRYLIYKIRYLIYIYKISYLIYKISHIKYKISNIGYKISYIAYKISYIAYKISYIVY